MEEIDRSSSGTTVTVSGFLWIQEVRRKMVKEVAEIMEVRNGLLAIALVYPMVRLQPYAHEPGDELITTNE